MKIGDRVKIKKGTSNWMKFHDFWIEKDMGTSIDEMEGTVKKDLFSEIEERYCHYALEIDGIPFLVGVHPMWLEELKEEQL